MSREALEEILARAMEDETFCNRLLQTPGNALTGYDLTAEEREALIGGNLREILLTVRRRGSSSPWLHSRGW